MQDYETNSKTKKKDFREEKEKYCLWFAGSTE
jgi:hypothetical protein